MESIPALIEALFNKRRSMQSYTAELEQLRALPYDDVADVLLTRMNKGKSYSSYVFDTLMEVNFRQSLLRMHHLLVKPGWHYLFAEAIYDHGDATDTAALIFIATHSRYSSARFLAVLGLHDFGTHAALTALQHIQATDRGKNAEGDTVRDLAAAAIRAIRAREGVLAPPDAADR